MGCCWAASGHAAGPGADHVSPHRIRREVPQKQTAQRAICNPCVPAFYRTTPRLDSRPRDLSAPAPGALCRPLAVGVRCASPCGVLGGPGAVSAVRYSWSLCGFLRPCGCALRRFPYVVALAACERPWRARLRFSRSGGVERAVERPTGPVTWSRRLPAERTGTRAATGTTRAARLPSPYVHLDVDVGVERDTHASNSP